METKGKKKKWIMMTGLLLVMVLALGVGVFFLWNSKTSKDQEQMSLPPQMAEMGENVISASGLTSVGMSDETLDFDFLETSLYVKESYLATGDQVEAGTVVFEVSAESLEEAKAELNDKVTETSLAYRQGVIDYETGKIEARITYETADVNRNYAQAEYDDAVSKASADVDDLTQQVEEARELVEEYEKSIQEDAYRSYYQVDELYQTYYEHFCLLMNKYEEWNIEELESRYGNSVSLGSTQNSGTSGSADASMGAQGNQGGNVQSNGMQSGGMQGGGMSEDAQKLSVYQMLDELVQQEGEAYQTALEEYENAKEQAQAGKTEAESNLQILESELIQAQTEYEKALITCQSDYEITLAESDNAQTVYETTLQSLEEALEELLQNKEEAQENLTLFEEVLGDGKFYTTKAGTIVMNAVRKDSYLSGNTMVIAYSNPETVTIAASVDQSDIAQLAVGDEALVVISEYGNYEGTITSINPVTQAESRSSVTYQVTVTLTGDISTLESNLTAYVYFGADVMKGKDLPEGVEGGFDGKDLPGDGEGGFDGKDLPQGGEGGFDGKNLPGDGEGSFDGKELPGDGEGFDGKGAPENGEGSAGMRK